MKEEGEEEGEGVDRPKCARDAADKSRDLQEALLKYLVYQSQNDSALVVRRAPVKMPSQLQYPCWRLTVANVRGVWRAA